MSRDNKSKVQLEEETKRGNIMINIFNTIIITLLNINKIKILVLKLTKILILYRTLILENGKLRKYFYNLNSKKK